MATKRKPINTTGASSMNFRPGTSAETSRIDTKGTRPTAHPPSIKEVLMMMILHVCKKTIFFDTNLKVALYLGSLFIVSLIGDFSPYPRSYFARSDNLFNVYFVKMGWAWTLLFALPFLVMTSYTLCCGDVKRLIKRHLPRIIIATIFWYVWTNFFNYIEALYGRCNVKNFDSKSQCLKAGHFWNGFDISGHAFILLYSSLVLIEEARPIVGWETIGEHLRNEEHSRVNSEQTKSRINPLKNLSDEEIVHLKHLYKRFTPAIRLLFIGITVLQLLWDIMLVCTMLYYHKMVEKVVSGIIAIFTWFLTYRVWYPSTSLLPETAGRGSFAYQKDKPSEPVQLRRQPSLVSNAAGVPSSSTSTGGGQKPMPKFMGMPLYASQTPSPAKPTGNRT